VLLLTMVVVGWLTRETFHAVRGSSRQETLSFLLAGALVLGTYLSGGWPVAGRRGRRRVVGPVLTGVLLVVAFWVLGALTSWIGPLDNGAEAMERNARALSGLGLVALVLAGGAEELFYRGALFERVRLPVFTTALAHMVTTLPAGNVALTLSAGFLGGVLGTTRRTSGGWWAPAVSHVVWAVLSVWWLA
jgi:membrane protease YdiL (CAAX protease family)